MFPVPDLGDPPFRIDREVRHVLVDLDVARLEAGPLVLAADSAGLDRPLNVEVAPILR